jgi:hypothetical protein
MFITYMDQQEEDDSTNRNKKVSPLSQSFLALFLLLPLPPFLFPFTFQNMIRDFLQDLLGEVSCDEDKHLIMDVLNVIKMCRHPDKLCTSWTVSPCPMGYTLVAYLPRSTTLNQVEVTHDDINSIESVNIFRVRVSIAQFFHNPSAPVSWGLKIHITSHRSPVSFTTYDPVKINVKRMMLNGASTSDSSSWASWLSNMLLHRKKENDTPDSVAGEGANKKRRKEEL